MCCVTCVPVTREIPKHEDRWNRSRQPSTPRRGGRRELETLSGARCFWQQLPHAGLTPQDSQKPHTAAGARPAREDVAEITTESPGLWPSRAQVWRGDTGPSERSKHSCLIGPLGRTDTRHTTVLTLGACAWTVASAGLWDNPTQGRKDFRFANWGLSPPWGAGCAPRSLHAQYPHVIYTEGSCGNHTHDLGTAPARRLAQGVRGWRAADQTRHLHPMHTHTQTRSWYRLHTRRSPYHVARYTRVCTTAGLCSRRVTPLTSCPSRPAVPDHDTNSLPRDLHPGSLDGVNGEPLSAEASRLSTLGGPATPLRARTWDDWWPEGWGHSVHSAFWWNACCPTPFQAPG